MNKVTIIDKIIKKLVLWAIPSSITPNQMTILRFILTPVVIYFVFIENYLIGIPLFVFTALTDAFDGAMARTRNQVTDWGKMFDPVADKVLISSTAVIVVTQAINQYLAFVIIGFEIMIVIAALYKKSKENIKIEAQKAGKVKMIFQSFGIGFAMLFLVLGTPWMLTVATMFLILSIFFAFLSLFVYHSI